MLGHSIVESIPSEYVQSICAAEGLIVEQLTSWCKACKAATAIAVKTSKVFLCGAASYQSRLHIDTAKSRHVP